MEPNLWAISQAQSPECVYSRWCIFCALNNFVKCLRKPGSPFDLHKNFLCIYEDDCTLVNHLDMTNLYLFLLTLHDLYIVHQLRGVTFNFFF